MVIVVLPAYNEAACIVGLIKDIKKVLSSRGYRVVVVNDGSSDDTLSLVEALVSEYQVVVVNHPVNMGLGATLRDGLAKAADISDSGDVIVTMDADATHDPEYIEPMLRKLDEGYDVVIASRFAAGGEERGLSAFRKTLSSGAGFLLHLLFPIPGVRDYTCGYRAYRARIIEGAFATLGDGFAREAGFSVSPETLITLGNLGAKVGEVPFTLRYDLKQGRSKIRIPKTIIAYLRMMWRLRRA